MGDKNTVVIQTNNGDGDNVSYSYSWDSVFVGRNYRGLSGRHVIDIDQGTLLIDNNVVAISTNTGTFNSSSFFGLNNNNTYFKITKFNVYSLKIYENDVLVRDYVPVINNSSEYGFFDNVNSVFVPVVNATGERPLQIRLTVSTTEETTFGTHIYTQSFSDFIVNNYKMYIKYPLENGGTSDFVNFNNVGTITEDNKYKFWATCNGTYTFKLHDQNDNYVSSATITITNVVSSIGGLEDNRVVLPRLHVYVLNGGTDLASIEIRTQSFPLDELDKYDCLFWTSSGIGTAQIPFLTQVKKEDDSFYFYETFSDIHGSVNTYFFKFYDKELKKYSTNVSLTVDKDKVLANWQQYNEESDDKNWFEKLFTPSQTKIDTLISSVTSKFGFIDSIKNSVSGLIDVLEGTNGAPQLVMTFDHEYLKGDVAVMDLSWYAPFKPYGDLVLTGFIYLFALWRFFINLPSIIAGIGGGIQSFPMGQEIIAFQKFGFGRSSSPIGKIGGKNK